MSILSKNKIIKTIQVIIIFIVLMVLVFGAGVFVARYLL